MGGGFIKTAVLSEIMRVPVKVAASTTTSTLALPLWQPFKDVWPPSS